MDRSLIDRYEALGEAPRAWIKGLSKADLLSAPDEGKWSMQQLVLHMLDSDMVGFDRMKRTIAMDEPALLAYDENRFVSRLKPERVDATLAADAFALNRRLMAQVLRAQPDDAFKRRGVHSEVGPVTLADLVGVYIDHVNHHAGFAARKRELLGAPAA